MFPSRLSSFNPLRSSNRASRPRAPVRHAHGGLQALVSPVGGAWSASVAPDLAARLSDAAALLHADADAAALVLEGAAHELIARWYACQGLRLPAPERLLADLAGHDELLALRLRLALRAPDVAARLGHLRALVRAMEE